ncbi:Regulator of drug sensitivity 1 [Coniochaeta hoffmannii]|uniref:Regulator of drug sensitivity 1 n=1 Tax=Coniochaeta hoffmannii TaxID=91930 RepID=A0AA38R7U9_9PEZI|nr:Regulator of drug sensitivity 1 [Coniochaeta hoffmannii]
MKSLSAIERANPPPRRKSCQACIKAKRRCDLGQPACLRCTQRLLECRYETGPLTARNRHAADGAGKKPLAATATVDADCPEPFALEVPENSGPAANDAASGMPDIPALAEQTLDAGFDFLSPDLDMDMLQFIQDVPLEPNVNDFFTIPRPPSPSYNKLDLALTQTDSVLALQPQAKWNLRTTPLSFTIAHRLQYAMDLVKDAPRRMVVDLQTPWCHPELYRDNMPQSMQDALASCGLYQAKNARNSAVILHTIRIRVEDLASTPAPRKPLEVIARVQALLLYVTILVFDGDILSRSAAEAAMPALESAVIGLVGLFGHNPYAEPSSSSASTTPAAPGPLPLYPIGPAREFWQGWVLQESARRTYMTTFFLLQLYLLLKGDVPKKCDQRLYLCHFWTVSAHLWQARDAFEFALAWRDRRHFVVNNTSIKQVLIEAQGDDVEEFGKMILTTLMGIDETKGWLHSRGATL